MQGPKYSLIQCLKQEKKPILKRDSMGRMLVVTIVRFRKS